MNEENQTNKIKGINILDYFYNKTIFKKKVLILIPHKCIFNLFLSTTNFKALTLIKKEKVKYKFSNNILTSIQLFFFMNFESIE